MWRWNCRKKECDEEENEESKWAEGEEEEGQQRNAVLSNPGMKPNNNEVLANEIRKRLLLKDRSWSPPPVNVASIYSLQLNWIGGANGADNISQQIHVSAMSENWHGRYMSTFQHANQNTMEHTEIIINIIKITTKNKLNGNVMTELESLILKRHMKYL